MGAGIIKCTEKRLVGDIGRHGILGQCQLEVKIHEYMIEQNYM